MQANMMVHAMAGLLGLKKPVEIRMTTDPKGFVGFGRDTPMAAHYETRRRKNKILRHVIFINLNVVVESSYSLPMVIGHELCHACQFENGIFNWEKHHDSSFQKLCKYLETEMKKLGFDIGKLYNPLTDVE